MDYIGEHLGPGYLGHFFIILSLVASLLATFAYFKVVSAKDPLRAASWKRLARGAFITEAISVVSIFAILFYIINNHLFEYKYAWQHSSRSLEAKYLLSCFWEGQEGSFLLWSFWHCVLGLVMIRRGKQWEAPVMTVVSFAQVCLATMVVGLYFFDQKIGSNPFVLMRHEGMFDGAPQFNDENGNLLVNYVSRITDGNDLNPLLQNYWMVIHPPVLFLGFASTIIPFAFAVGGLWTKKYGDWARAAMPWSLFSAAVLGTGIMMGGAWAYESLNFGGYWAWDPVENASLVPWLVLIAGIHTLMIYKSTGRSLRATNLFFILSFLLVLYSTFLTRSGILGDTSVHAFTDLGMNAQLFLFLYVFVWLSAIVSGKNNSERVFAASAAIVFLLGGYFVHSTISFFSIIGGVLLAGYYINRNVPSPFKDEERTSSREFWMFIGSLVFFLTAVFIICATSLPVINKFFNTNLTMGEDSVYSYNSIVIWICITVATLTAVGQYLKYKQTGKKFFISKIVWPTVIAIFISALVIAFGNIDYREHGPGFLGAIWLALACSIYSVVANAGYIWIGMKGKLNLSGASIAHFGFGLMLVGILISSSKKEVLSYNTSGIFVPLGENKITGKAGENLTLIKGQKMDMGKYWVSFESKYKDKLRNDKWYYRLNFETKDGKKAFSLTPNAFINLKTGDLSPNPDAKRYLTYDIFTYITALPRNPAEDSSGVTAVVKGIGDTIFYSNGFMTLDSVIFNPSNKKYQFTKKDTALMASLTIRPKSGGVFKAQPVYQFKNNRAIQHIDTIASQALAISFTGVADEKKIELSISDSNKPQEFLTMKAYKFPFINLVWAGTILMVIGFFISMARRISLNKAANEVDNLPL
jgi:cytochrome c-type biogenesis protein CcmF